MHAYSSYGYVHVYILLPRAPDPHLLALPDHFFLISSSGTSRPFVFLFAAENFGPTQSLTSKQETVCVFLCLIKPVFGNRPGVSSVAADAGQEGHVPVTREPHAHGPDPRTEGQELTRADPLSLVITLPYRWGHYTPLSVGSSKM